MQNMLSALSNALNFVQCSHLNVDLFLTIRSIFVMGMSDMLKSACLLAVTSISHRVLRKLPTSWTAAEIWQKLCSLYLNKNCKECVYTSRQIL